MKKAFFVLCDTTVVVKFHANNISISGATTRSRNNQNYARSIYPNLHGELLLSKRGKPADVDNHIAWVGGWVVEWVGGWMDGWVGGMVVIAAMTNKRFLIPILVSEDRRLLAEKENDEGQGWWFG